MKHRRQRGQVLLLGVAVLFILLIAVLLLFDLHNGIRAKIKVESAQQAAALAGAGWQRDGLNLIGQMNLLKATVMMTAADSPVAAPPPILAEPGSRRAMLLAMNSRVRAITENQSRVAFLVPLLGNLAVQQTAKQNHMPANQTGLFRHYLERTLAHNDYRFTPIGGFYWYGAYQSLLNDTVEQQCAVRVNARIDEMPEVWSNSEGSIGDSGFRLLLSDPALYHAIRNRNFCYWQLMQMAKAGIVLGDPWWKINYTPAPFVGESELMPLGVAYRSATVDPEILEERFAGGVSLPAEVRQDLEQNPVTWCVYDAMWYPSSFHPEAYEAQQEFWQRGWWLRDDRRPGFLYEGCYTAVDNYVEVTRFNRAGMNEAGNRDGMPFIHRLGRDQGERRNIVGTDSRDGSNAEIRGVVAKVLGHFRTGSDAGDVPIVTPLILPVFHKVALIPSSMPYTLNMLTGGPDDLKRFLQWLATHPDLAEDTPPSGTEKYLALLLKLTDERFLKSIYNPDFPGVDSLSPEVIFGGAYLYEDTPDGAGWLQEAFLFRAASAPKDEYGVSLVPDRQPTTIENMEHDGARRVYYGTAGSGYSYYLIRNGRILTNEDIGCGAARRSSGPGPLVDGLNTGPGRL
ncbi:MAG: hypothetical protein IJC73_00485 [Lentisphaeria bacterium]|nr:hypothetical protein [Lentisphaeria bacterium]